MRRQLCGAFREVEVVGELGARLGLALAQLRRHPAAPPEGLAQGADEVGILAEALHQDGASAVERGLGVGDSSIGSHEPRRRRFRREIRPAEQQVRQRPEPSLTRRLGPRAALRPERQVDVFEPALAVGREDGGLERRIELALLANGFQHGGAALFEVAQVGQALVEATELRVVERARRLLAVARDERHRGAPVDQRHGGRDLLRVYAEVARDARDDRSRHAGPLDECHTVMTSTIRSAVNPDRPPRSRAGTDGPDRRRGS